MVIWGCSFLCCWGSSAFCFHLPFQGGESQGGRLERPAAGSSGIRSSLCFSPPKTTEGNKLKHLWDVEKKKWAFLVNQACAKIQVCHLAAIWLKKRSQGSPQGAHIPEGWRPTPQWVCLMSSVRAAPWFVSNGQCHCRAHASDGADADPTTTP